MNNKLKVTDTMKQSKAESWLKAAGYPLMLNGARYHVIYFIVSFLLIVNYILAPILTRSDLGIITIALVAGAILFLLPSFQWSAFVYVMKRIVDYREAKRNAEVFMLYDLVINELEMMSSSRTNTFNLLKKLMPYFDVINDSFAKLLTTWNNDKGPKIALEEFGEDIGTKEAKSLASVLKTLDEVDKETAIQNLNDINNMFARSQIENYRRRKKVTLDLASIPIKATHFVVILNFIVVIIVMVGILMEANRS
ncbi:hypothetical protein [Pontibacillus halophilus]|uniref:hypothetical protein n=1 Tax=Pontibacillus halophilus TaxID=516704 RepID=UPI0013772E2F|nr:hypothetical protein [Pontibacillus halophilus]